MNTEILGVALQIVLLIVISYPLGKYIAKVYKGEKTWSDFMKPVERLIYKVAGVNPEEEMNWKQFLKALLILNAFWFVWGMVLLCTQQWLPLNPDGNANQTPDLAFNTCISFMVIRSVSHHLLPKLSCSFGSPYPTTISSFIFAKVPSLIPCTFIISSIAANGPFSSL